MKLKETIAVLAILRAAYPGFYSTLPDNEIDSIINLWADMFAEDDYEVVKAAVKALIATEKSSYPPVVGRVKEEIYKATHPAQMSETEAFALIKRAMKYACRLNYVGREKHNYQQEAYDALPPAIKRVVGTPSQLREWTNMDSETFESVVASNIMRAYRTVSAQQAEWEKMPSEIRAITGNANALFAMPEYAINAKGSNE